MVHPGGCKHFLIGNVGGKFAIATSGVASPKFDSLVALLEYYHTSPALAGVRLKRQRGTAARETAGGPAPTMAGAAGAIEAIHADGKCLECGTTNSKTARFCKGCGVSFGRSSAGVTSTGAPAGVSADMTAAATDRAMLSSEPKIASTGESLAFLILAQQLDTSRKLFRLISLGNDILEAEKSNVLLDGEMEKLRQIYRNCRTQLAEGCPRSVWTPDKSAPSCQVCSAKFTAARRRHHCRGCGKCVCRGCSSQSFERAQLSLSKVCPVCYQFLSEVAAGHVRQATVTFADAFKGQ